MYAKRHSLDKHGKTIVDETRINIEESLIVQHQEKTIEENGEFKMEVEDTIL